MRDCYLVITSGKGLFLDCAELLNVNGLHHLFAVAYRRLLKGLTAAELLDDAGLLEFTFEFLEGSFDVLAFFDLYDNLCLWCCYIFLICI